MGKFVYHKLAGFFFLFIVLFQLQGMPAAEAGLISTKEEINLGKSTAQELEKKYGVVQDPVLQERIEQIGQRIVGVSSRQDLPYTFKVLNTDEINALAVPGGFIYLYKGLVDYMPSDDELAGVIGHEVGHVAKRHTVRQIEKNLGISLLFNIFFQNRGAMLQNLVFNAVMADYSRDDERQADELGFTYAMQAGYNPYSMLLTLHKLKEKEGHATYGLFSSHPNSDSRIAQAEGYIKQANIKPQVVKNGDTIRITDGDWQLPPITAAYGGYQPLYRSYFVAGKLYALANQPNFNQQRFHIATAADLVQVAYDDASIITITQEDAQTNGLSPDELAEQYVALLRQWTP